MNPRHAKALLLPFQKLMFGAVGVLAAAENAINLAPSEDEANTVAINLLDKFADLSIEISEQIIAATKGLPCPCESCKAERATAMAQAEAIFSGGE
jgi:hypothetical protein